MANTQDAGDELATVVVTATRFETAPQINPIASQVITAEEIRESSATTLSEVLGKLGGVLTRSSFTGIPDASIDLRGFGVAGDQNTLVLVNGQRLSEFEGISARLSSIPLSAIDRIEILRGSGSVLYGSGATGGTINIITSSQMKEGANGMLSMATGSYRLQDQQARIQVKDKQWGFHLNGQNYTTDNYRLGNQAQLRAVSGEIRYEEVQDFLALNFGADEQQSRLPGVRQVDLTTGLDQLLNDPRGITTPNDYLNSTTDFMTLRGEKRLDDVTFAFDLTNRHKDRSSFGSYDWGGTSLTHSKVTITSLSPRLQWNTQMAQMRNALTIGSDWSDWSYQNKTVGDGGSDSFNEIGKQRSLATYVRNELLATEKLRISAGYRQEAMKQNSVLDNSASDRTTQPRLTANELALEYQWFSNVNAFGRTGDSYRVANIDENRCIWAPCSDLLLPQTAHQNEVGLEWRDAFSQFRVGFFDMAINNEIHYNGLTGTNMNLPPTLHRGLELEAKWQLTSDWSLTSRYVRTQARFLEGTYLSYMGFSASMAGKEVPLVPADRLNAQIGWQIDSFTRLTTALSYVGAQRYDNDQANSFQRMPSYSIVDFKIVHRMASWNLSLGINNLLDKSYYTYGVTNVAAAPSRFNAYPEARRNGYFTAEYKF